MSHSPYMIRNYRSWDSDKLVLLEAEAHEIGGMWSPISPLDLIERLGQPKRSLEKNLFIAERAGEVMGYVDVRPELKIGRVVLGCLVHPKHRKSGAAFELFRRAIGRTRELGLKVIHVNVLQKSAMAKQILTEIGFSSIRRFLELRLDLSSTHLPEISRMPFRCRSLRPGEERRLTQLQNRSFKSTWGFNANAVEEILRRTRLPSCSLKDILLALDGDKPVGYCWTRTIFWKNEAPDQGTGRIYMLGVDPDYRGRGIGRQLLLAGLSYLKSRGLRVAELTVDSENKAARPLYRSVGFKLWTSSFWYEKRLE